jgi:hypothetical protein
LVFSRFILVLIPANLTKKERESAELFERRAFSHSSRRETIQHFNKSQRNREIVRFRYQRPSREFKGQNSTSRLCCLHGRKIPYFFPFDWVKSFFNFTFFEHFRMIAAGANRSTGSVETVVRHSSGRLESRNISGGIGNRTISVSGV